MKPVRLFLRLTAALNDQLSELMCSWSAASAGAFVALGAKTVVIAEGPGHQRDTYLVLAKS